MNRSRVLIGGLVGLVAVVGLLGWWLGYFSDTPDEVSIEDSVAALDDDAGENSAGDETDETDEADESEADPDDAETADATPVEEQAANLDDITGVWNVQVNEDATFVGYRINEVLTTIGDFEVVGRTGDVAGTLEADGTTITTASLIAQTATLTTDNGRRDEAMRSQALETGEFPEATFELTAPIELGVIPAAGESVSATALGDLTIHGVTQAVELALEAALVDSSIVVTGQTQVALADFDISLPQAPIVASVEDEAVIELSVVFAR